MPTQTRRNFLQSATRRPCHGFCSAPQQATPCLSLWLAHRPPALLRPRHACKDYEGTLKQLAALGYQEVEAAGYFDYTPHQVKDAMSSGWSPLRQRPLPLCQP